MKASKASRKTVTFRLDDEDRRILEDYAIKLSTAEHERYSNNGALCHMIENAEVGARVKEIADADPENQKPVTFRLADKHRQLLTEYVIKMQAVLNRRISNNEALRHMFRTAKVKASKKSAAAVANA